MTMAESIPDAATQAPTQDFLAFLAGVNKGRTVTELGEMLQVLAAAVENTGKSGTLTLKFTMKPAGTNSDAVTVTDEVLLKAPRLKRPESIFFLDADHNLVRNHPNQNSLFD
jgi:hypothetical protein